MLHSSPLLPRGRAVFNARKSAWCPVHVREWPTLTLMCVTVSHSPPLEGRTPVGAPFGTEAAPRATRYSLTPVPNLPSASKVARGQGSAFRSEGGVPTVPCVGRHMGSYACLHETAADTWARARRFWPGT